MNNKYNHTQVTSKLIQHIFKFLLHRIANIYYSMYNIMLTKLRDLNGDVTYCGYLAIQQLTQNVYKINKGRN